MKDIINHQDSDFILFLKSQGISITFEIMTFKHISSLRCNLCNHYIHDYIEYYHSICDRIEIFAEHYIKQHSELRLLKPDLCDSELRHDIKIFNRTYAILQQLLIYARNYNIRGAKLKKGSVIWTLQKEFQIPLIVLRNILDISEQKLGDLAYAYVESINELPSWAKNSKD